MPIYRVFFVSESGGVVGSDDLDAPHNAEATVRAAVLADACSDLCAGFEVWRGARRIALQRPLNGSITKLKARMSESTHEAVIKGVERILQSRTRVARSKKLLATLEAAKGER